MKTKPCIRKILDAREAANGDREAAFVDAYWALSELCDERGVDEASVMETVRGMHTLRRLVASQARRSITSRPSRSPSQGEGS